MRPCSWDYLWHDSGIYHFYAGQKALRSQRMRPCSWDYLWHESGIYLFYAGQKALRSQRCALARGIICGMKAVFIVIFTQARTRCAPSANALVGGKKMDLKAVEYFYAGILSPGLNAC